jgi:hypothetical protein
VGRRRGRRGPRCAGPGHKQPPETGPGRGLGCGPAASAAGALVGVAKPPARRGRGRRPRAPVSDITPSRGSSRKPRVEALGEGVQYVDPVGGLELPVDPDRQTFVRMRPLDRLVVTFTSRRQIRSSPLVADDPAGGRTQHLCDLTITNGSVAAGLRRRQSTARHRLADAPLGDRCYPSTRQIRRSIASVTDLPAMSAPRPRDASRRSFSAGDASSILILFLPKDIPRGGQFIGAGSFQRASCKIIWSASHNPSQIEAMYFRIHPTFVKAIF